MPERVRTAPRSPSQSFLPLVAWLSVGNTTLQSVFYVELRRAENRPSAGVSRMVTYESRPVLVQKCFLQRRGAQHKRPRSEIRCSAHLCMYIGPAIQTYTNSAL